MLKDENHIQTKKEQAQSKLETLQPLEDPSIKFLKNIDNIAVDTGIKDLAENHDHYLYGLPKK